jgi:MFS family permease
MTITATEVSAAEDRQARNNTLVLIAAQAFGGAAPAINITLAGLTGTYLLGADKSLATLPVSTFLVGVALGAFPAAMLMRRVGRRAGFISGTFVGVAGGIFSGFSVMAGSFLGLVIGSMISGLAISFIHQYRFAAADTGSPAFRARAVSWVLAGGIGAGVIGPQVAIFSADLLAPIPFAGAFFAMSAVSFVGMFPLLLLRGAGRPPSSREADSGGRPLLEIAMQPRFIVALVCAIGSYCLMSLLMTAAPLAMVAHQHGQANAALGIQWHVLGMFAPSFITGALIARFGPEVIMTAGFLLLALCAGVALAGVDLMNFWLALILLGIGWNFGFLGATMMLTQTYAPEEKSKVQGVSDFLVFGSVAATSLLSGRLFATMGWGWINLAALPIVAVCLLALMFTLLRQRREAI